MDDLKNRSFRIDERKSFSFDSKKFTRSNTIHLASEVGSSLSSRFMPYEKLSDSTRLHDVDDSSSIHGRRSRNGGAWAFVSKIFSLKKAGGHSSDRQSSSWKPDPNRRWPLQGW